jgi:hypothetical protein
MKKEPTGIPLLLGFILIVVATNTIVYAEEPKFCDEWGIIGLGSLYMKSSTLKITENDITWPGCQSAPYKVTSSENNAWKLLVPKLSCSGIGGIQKDSGEGYIMMLALEDQDELKIKVYDARGNVAKAKELAWGDFYRIPFDKERNFFGQIGNYPITMHLQVSKKGNVEGNYSYDKYKEKIPLRGKISGGNILLNVYSDTNNVLEIFHGKYIDGKINGIWRHKEKVLKLHLVREPWDDHYISCEEMKKYPERVFGERDIDLGTGSGSPNEVDYDCEGGLATLKFMKKLYDLTEAIRGDGADCGGTIVHAHWRYYRYTMLKLGLAPGEGGGVDPNTLHYFRLWAHQSLSNFELHSTFWKEYNQAKPLLIRHYREKFSVPLEKATDYAYTALSIFVERAAGTWPRALLFGERDEDLRDRESRPTITSIDEAMADPNTAVKDLEGIIKETISKRELDQALRTALLYQRPQRILELLLKKGASINSGDESGLFFALRNREHVKFLLGRGADVNYENMFGKTALFYAIGFNDIGMVRLLLDHKADVNHSYKNKEDILSIEWDKTPFYQQSFCFRNLRERTPLMHAAQHGNPALIKLLLQHGAKLDSTDQKEFNAADYARVGGKAENLKYLKSLGLEENVPGRGL